MPVLKLTQNFVANELHCPEGRKRIEYCDSDVPGLYVLVGATAKVSTYYLRWKNVAGKTCHTKIGRTTDLDLADARKAAKRLKAEVALGMDSKEEKKERLAVLTFGEFFEGNYLPYVQPRKRSWRRDEELYRLRIKDAFGKKPLDQITRKELQAFHTAILDSGLAPATANHHIKLIKHALNLAVEWEMLEKNPATRIPLFFEDNKVENYLSETELERLVNVLRTDSNRSVCQIALFLLSSGCRVNEALSAKWTDVDLESRTFCIRATNSKSRKMRSVPLNDSALDVLRQLGTEGKYEYLFINHRTKKRYTTIMKGWTRLRIKAGLPHLRLHDLRHMYASFLVCGGRTLYEVQQILGHSDPKVTMRYAHLSTKALQEAASSASVKIQGAMHPPAE